MLLILCLIGAYLFGSISSAVIACKAMGLPDPRTQGSGNPGATNVARIGGKKLGVVVLIIDTIKGVLPVLIAKSLGISAEGLSGIALAVFLGHLYPIFFHFRGGKGVATGLGAMLVLSWPVVVVGLIIWMLTILITRYVSLASINAAASTIISAWWLAPAGTYIAIVLMSLLLIFRHRQNIERLIAGTESKFGSKNK